MGMSKAVPSSVPSSTGNDNVPVLTSPQLGPYQPMSGNPVIPVVPRSDDQSEKTLPAQPKYGHTVSDGSERGSGSEGAPSVPTDGFLFIKGPADPHYMSEQVDKDPYGKVNNPPTRGMLTAIWQYLNNIAYSQRTDETGFKISGPQQRTSVSRITPPPHGDGYSPQTYTPRQMPQRENTYKFNPVTGTDRYGTGVLNSDTFGAGQTYGGQGGNQYTPSPGPPDTRSTAGQPPNPSGMPTWG